MLTTILNLNKRVLVVDAGENPSLMAIGQGLLDEGINVGFLCKGEDLTEEIAKEIVEKDDINGFHDDFVNGWAYLNYKDDVYVYTEKFSALDSFISAIEANGNWWLKNPLGDEPRSYSEVMDGVSADELMEELKEWQEAESKTFKNPLIFEIL